MKGQETRELCRKTGDGKLPKPDLPKCVMFVVREASVLCFQKKSALLCVHARTSFSPLSLHPSFYILYPIPPVS